MPWLVSALHACTLLAPSDAELTSPETAGEDSGTHDSRGDESEVSSPEPDADASHGDASDAPADACGPPLTPCSRTNETPSRSRAGRATAAFKPDRGAACRSFATGVHGAHGAPARTSPLFARPATAKSTSGAAASATRASSRARAFAPARAPGTHGAHGARVGASRQSASPITGAAAALAHGNGVERAPVCGVALATPRAAPVARIARAEGVHTSCVRLRAV